MRSTVVSVLVLSLASPVGGGTTATVTCAPGITVTY